MTSASKCSRSPAVPRLVGNSNRARKKSASRSNSAATQPSSSTATPGGASVFRCSRRAHSATPGNRASASSVFTDRQSLAEQAFGLLGVGGVLINQAPTFRVENMPYGGVKESGFGREGIRYAMDEMTEIKSLIFNFSEP